MQYFGVYAPPVPLPLLTGEAGKTQEHLSYKIVRPSLVTAELIGPDLQPRVHVQLALGVGLVVGLTLWRSRRHLLGSLPSLAVSLATCTMVGLGTLIVYQVP